MACKKFWSTGKASKLRMTAIRIIKCPFMTMNKKADIWPKKLATALDWLPSAGLKKAAKFRPI